MHLPCIISNSEGSGQPATQHLCGFSGSDSTLVLLDYLVILNDSEGSHKILRQAQNDNRVSGYLLLDGRYWEQAESEVKSSKLQAASKV